MFTPWHYVFMPLFKKNIFLENSSKIFIFPEIAAKIFLEKRPQHWSEWLHSYSAQNSVYHASYCSALIIRACKIFVKYILLYWDHEATFFKSYWQKMYFCSVSNKNLGEVGGIKILQKGANTIFNSFESSVDNQKQTFKSSLSLNHSWNIYE